MGKGLGGGWSGQRGVTGGVAAQHEPSPLGQEGVAGPGSLRWGALWKCLLAVGRQVCRLVSQHPTLSMSCCSVGLASPRERQVLGIHSYRRLVLFKKLMFWFLYLDKGWSLFDSTSIRHGLQPAGRCRLALQSSLKREINVKLYNNRRACFGPQVCACLVLPPQVHPGQGDPRRSQGGCLHLCFYSSVGT